MKYSRQWLSPWLLLILSVSTPWLSFADTDDYRVQVGDIIRISLPGETSLDRNFAVDRSGRLLLPEIGAIEVAQLSESRLQTQIHTALSRIFQDLHHLDVYVYKRQLLLNVLGYVSKPGEVVLPADASLQAALQAAGGMRSGAQLNRLQIRRGAEVIEFDYKQYLDTGNDAQLPKLHSLDTLFVPASPKIGNVEVAFDPAKIADGGDASDARLAIKVFGEVNRPGSFSYLESLSLIDLLMRAGGVTRYAGVEQIRIITKDRPQQFDLKSYLDSGDATLLPAMTPGSTIYVPREEAMINTGANTVYVMGEVFKPGAYERAQNASFMDILANAGGPTRYAETRQLRLLKSNGEVVRFDLSAFTEGLAAVHMPTISAGDTLFVPEKTETSGSSWLQVAPDRAVRVLGAVQKPGRIEWSDEMSLLDLLAQVGGPSVRADTRHIEVITPTRNGAVTTHRFDLDRFLSDGLSDRALPQILAGATIRVHTLPAETGGNKTQWLNQAASESIYVFGQVGAPGRYRFEDHLHFLDILSAASGPTTKADLQNIRISHRDGKHARVSTVNLALYFETGDEHLLPKLRRGDSIYIPSRDRHWLEESQGSTIRVLGAVQQPGRYRFNDSMSVLDLLAQAGGPTDKALIKRIAVINQSCCQDQARIFNLERFSKAPVFSQLPVLRAGDTVYVPTREDSMFNKARTGLEDIFRLVSLGVLLGI